MLQPLLVVEYLFSKLFYFYVTRQKYTNDVSVMIYTITARDFSPSCFHVYEGIK